MFRSAIVKLTSVCNINCRYCYMFNQLDQTHSRVPPKMAPAIALQLLDRICAYSPPGDPQPFSIVLHGGEPLLWNESHLIGWLAQVEQRRKQGWNLDVAIQTNLIRPLSSPLVDALHRHRISLGISLDGPRETHDSQRVDHLGRGTYERVMASVEKLVASGDDALIGGFLSVANPSVAPADYLQWVRTLPVTRVDVLWPMEFNWRNPPWSVFSRRQYEQHPRYGSWFAALFEAWWRHDDPALQIRLFNNLLQVWLGGGEHIDALVNDCYDMFVVNTDGGIEYPDYLRNAADGSARTPFNVMRHGLSELHDDEVFHRLLNLKQSCPAKCLTCRHRAICGGGFLPGRSDPQQLISSRESVLCADQMHFFDRAIRIIQQALQQRGEYEYSDGSATSHAR